MTFPGEYLIDIIRMAKARYGVKSIGAIIIGRPQAIEFGRHIDAEYKEENTLILLDAPDPYAQLAERYAHSVTTSSKIQVDGRLYEGVARFSKFEGTPLFIKDWDRAPVFIVKHQGAIEWEEDASG